MTYRQRVLVLLFGAYFAAALYFKLAMGNAQMFSHIAFGHVFYLGIAGVPAIYASLNCGRRSIWSGFGAAVLMALAIFWLFLLAFASGLPGNEWIGAGLMHCVLILPLFSAVVLPIKLPRAIPMLACATLVGLVVITTGLPIVVRHFLSLQVDTTLAQGGCVYAGRDVTRKIGSAQDVDFGWFIGPASESVWFVKGQDTFKWSYSALGSMPVNGLPSWAHVKGKELVCS